MNNMFYIAYNLEYTNYFVKGNITWAIINFICILWFYRLLALTIVVLDVRSMRFHIIKTFRGAGWPSVHTGRANHRRHAREDKSEYHILETSLINCRKERLLGIFRCHIRWYLTWLNLILFFNNARISVKLNRLNLKCNTHATDYYNYFSYGSKIKITTHLSIQYCHLPRRSIYGASQHSVFMLAS